MEKKSKRTSQKRRL